MDLLEMSEKILLIDTLTPRTCQFEKKNPQQSGRWWEEISEKENISKQKYHLHMNYKCLYYNGAPSSRCKRKVNECVECYRDSSRIIRAKYKENQTTIKKKAYERMNRPEMYMWFIESLGLVKEEKMDDCFSYIENIWNNKKNCKEIRVYLSKEYGITLESIEIKLESINEQI